MKCESAGIRLQPQDGRGKTALILNPFLEGMREAGSEVELFYTRRLEINPCQGCFICWYKTPGKCFQQDDMQMLLPKLREAGIWVFATLVHFSGFSALMKNLMGKRSGGLPQHIRVQMIYTYHILWGSQRISGKDLSRIPMCSGHSLCQALFIVAERLP